MTPTCEHGPDRAPATTSQTALPKWDIGATDFGIFIALLLAGMVVGSGLGDLAVARLWPAWSSEGDGHLQMLGRNFGMQAGLLVAYFGFRCLTGGASDREAQLIRPRSNPLLIALKWLAISYVFIFLLGGLWNWALTQIGYEQVVQEPVRLVQEGGDLAERLFLYFTIVVMAPICEELVFRGGIFRYLHHRLPLALATSLSAFFFALVHFNLFSFLPLLVLGVALALAFRESGSILSSILFHAVFNAVSLALILFTRHSPP